MQTDLRGTELYKRMQAADGHWLQHHPAIADCGARVIGWFQEHMPSGSNARR